MPLTSRSGRGYDGQILRLAVPAFGALIAEPLFLLTDTVVVSRLPAPALGALGVASTVLSTAVGLCVFLAYGTTAAVARRIGAGDTGQALRQAVDGLWLAAGVGLVIVVVLWPLAPSLAGLIGAEGELARQAVTYLRISLLGVPAMLLVLAGTGVLRGMQDTTTPLVVSVGAFTLNAVLNVTFVLGLGWGIAGSAWGTVLAQSAAAAVYLLLIFIRHGAPFRPDLAGVRAAGSAGIALVVRTACLQLVLGVATAVATRMGENQIEAHTVALRVWTLLAFALDAIAIAGQAITGRALGAGDVAEVRGATRRMVVWGIGSGVVLGLLVIVARPFTPALFDAGPAVAGELLDALWVVAALQPVAGVVFVLDGVLIGAGDQRYLAWAGVWTTLAYLPAALLVVTAGGGLVALWLALGVWMAARLVTLAVRARGTSWLVVGV
ncbi:putative MATE family efflux protein [Streptosporangium becharense]|uniref:Putative MATE family efflux protein n=1 Tax=Streptosporangium becharense TaxID=1816182 RepID=A0A7W9IGW6_9ACTN|nr:MATE family efflux transporter [Streptosporangium becharense]MBB2912694.1 putative MATE family efflux protein [Streptosporangium becharense]MBB5820477.1 putative MATE family efflux protein [Streptosporangium becharense]